MSNTLLHSQLKAEHALHGGGRSCFCCTYAGSTKSGPRSRQKLRQIGRRRESRAWKAEL